MTTRVDYDKLIRVRLPQLIRQRGNTPGTQEILDPRISDGLFRKKVLEEAQELIEAEADDDILEEACDVVQVVLDFIKTKGFSPEDLEVVRYAKEIKRGTFLTNQRNAILLKYVDNK
jgi:predicted house-cleaning noncanonical NTP pyrophosphatase (MazG superfamily)